MKEKTKKITLTAIGIFFITFGIFAMDFSIYRSNWGWVLWLCYWGMIIIGFGILTKNSYLILSQLNMLAIPLIFWNIDFFYFLIKKKSLWGISDYFFSEMMKAARFISLEHIFLIPLSIFALYFIKIKRTDAWKLSIIQTIIFFTLSRFFTNQNDNVNFVFYSPISIIPTNSWYLLKWFIISNMAILLTNFLIIKIPGIKNFSQTKITFNKLNN